MNEKISILDDQVMFHICQKDQQTHLMHALLTLYISEKY